MEASNVKKMREALEKAVGHCNGCKAPKETACRETCGAPWMAEWIDDAIAALAAPHRNCDRFSTKDEAWDAFAHTYFGPTDPEYIFDAFARWLFAAVQEGGDHADA